jgi:hypothetical protein
VRLRADHGIKFYGRQIALCANCRIAWEPIDSALIWDCGSSIPRSSQ